MRPETCSDKAVTLFNAMHIQSTFCQVRQLRCRYSH